MARSRLPRIGMVMGVQNEEPFLHAHLAYHRMIGVERVYLFLDRSTDGTADIATRFPGTRVVDVGPLGMLRAGAHVAEFHRLAMDQAMVWAREEGLDWLMVLDPDEFAFADNLRTEVDERRPSVLAQDADLRTLLAAVGDETLQVCLTTREVLPCREYAEAGFAEQPYFQGTPPVERRIFNPLTGATQVWSDFIGHRQGKCLVRTRAAVQGYDSHRWTTDQSAARPARPDFVPLPTLVRGWHAHYFITGYAHWLNKYRQLRSEPERWPCGEPVELPIETWKSVYRERDRLASLEDYLRDHVFLAEADLVEEVSSGRAVRDERVKRLIGEAMRLHPLAARALVEVESNDLSRWKEPVRPARGPLDYDLSPVALPPSELQGFFPVELHRGDLFRWSQPSATIRMNLPAGRYALEARLGPWVDPSHVRTLVLELSGQPLAVSWSGAKPHTIRTSFTVASTIDARNALAIFAAELPNHSNDPRSLSLPWIGLNARRVGPPSAADPKGSGAHRVPEWWRHWTAPTEYRRWRNRRSRAAHPFAILSWGRSGSTLLRCLLNRHPDITCYGELLHPHTQKFPASLGPPPRYLSHPDFSVRHPERALDTIYRLPCRNGILGWKLTYAQNMGVWNLLASDPSITRILLTRANRLRQFVSLQFAELVDVWNIPGDDAEQRTAYASIRPARLHIDPDAFLERAELWERQREETLARFVGGGGSWIEVAYRDVAGRGRQETLNRICLLLGARPGLGPDEPPTIRLNPEPLESLVENFAELRGRLRRHAFAWMLDDDDEA